MFSASPRIGENVRNWIGKKVGIDGPAELKTLSFEMIHQRSSTSSELGDLDDVSTTDTALHAYFMAVRVVEPNQSSVEWRPSHWQRSELNASQITLTFDDDSSRNDARLS